MKTKLSPLLVGALLASSSGYLYAENLADVYQLALKSDPIVLKTQAQASAAKEGIAQAKAALLPHINATANISKNTRDSQNYNDVFGPLGSTITSTSDQTSYGAGLSMQLYHHDSWLRMSNAKKGALQSDINFRLAKQNLIVRVTKAYFDVLSAKDNVEFANAEKKAISRQLEQTKQRFAVGLTAITDVHEAQAKFDDAVAKVIQATNQVYNNEEALRTITNQYPRNLETLNTATFSASIPLPNDINQWQKIAENKSLALMTRKISMDIAKENINIAKAGHYPTLDLSGNIGRAKSKSGFNTANGSRNFPYTPYFDNQSVGVTLTIPIYSGGATSSIVRQAQQNYVITSEDMDLTHRDIVRKTRNAFNNVRAAISSIKALQQSVVSAKSALKATEAGFEVGTRTIVDVLNSTRNLYNAKRNLSATRYSYIESVLNLKLAGGMISAQDIIDINQGLSK